MSGFIPSGVKPARRVPKAYFSAFFFDAFAAARRSVFLRRAARFLTLSLPWLFPIRRDIRPGRPGSQAKFGSIIRSAIAEEKNQEGERSDCGPERGGQKPATGLKAG